MHPYLDPNCKPMGYILCVSEYSTFVANDANGTYHTAGSIHCKDVDFPV